MVNASVLASLLLLVAAAATGQGRVAELPDAEIERRRIEALLYSGQRAEAADEAARLVAQAGAAPELARVGDYIRCHLLFLNYRRACTDERLEPEAGRQAEHAFTLFLATPAATPTQRKARFLFALFLQDRARALQERNNVLFAPEIGRDLRRSNAAFTTIARSAAAAAEDAEAAGLRRWSRVQLTVNLYLLARVYSPSDRRRAPTLAMALDRLSRLAEEFRGLPEGNRAYFHYGLALELYGAAENAREVFVNLWRSVPWAEESGPFLEEILWNVCRLDRTAGLRAQVIAAALMLRRRLHTTRRAPSRFAVRIVAAAADCRLDTEGPSAAAAALESAADWLEARGAPVTPELRAVAVRVADAAADVLRPRRHARVMLLAARGLLAANRVRDGRDRAAAVATCGALASEIRARAFRYASRAWETLGFLREAVRAHDEALRLHRPQDERARTAALRRTAALLERIAAHSRSPLDGERSRAARSRVPAPLGQAEYRQGAAAYRRGDLAQAARLLSRVPEASRCHPLALVLCAHIDYLSVPEDATASKRLESILSRLARLDRLRPDAPNWLTAQAFRLFTQAQVKRALGDLDGAALDLAHYETRFADRPTLVAEALALRVAVAVDRRGLSSARSTLAVLADRFPENRSYGEACLHLARALRERANRASDGAADRSLLRESVRLRRRARGVLGPAFSARHRYLLAVDEMALGRHDRALELLQALEREQPASLAPARDGLTLRRVRCLMHLGRLAEAEAVIGALVARKPDHLAPLRLQAVLLGGTALTTAGTVTELRYLDRPLPAFTRWERIKAHAEQVTPYAPIWFEAQFHIALLNHWRGNTERVRAILRWIEVSGYDPLGGNDYAERFRWLAREVGWKKEE